MADDHDRLSTFENIRLKTLEKLDILISSLVGQMIMLVEAVTAESHNLAVEWERIFIREKKRRRTGQVLVRNLPLFKQIGRASCRERV